MRTLDCVRYLQAMQIAEVRFEITKETEDNGMLIDILLSQWRANGQILGREFPIIFTGNTYCCFLMLPQADSLAQHHNSKYVTSTTSRLLEAGLKAITVTILGKDPFSAEPCSCCSRSYFILYTYYVSLESSLRCGDCFGSVPLYTVPPHVISAGELHDQIMSWQSDYQACDQLQMNCSTGEKFGLREISQHNSSLSKRGKEICHGIADATGIPTYYYLHRDRGKSLKRERSRKCPSCGNDWLLAEQLHNTFDFKCDCCLLLSNIALSIPCLNQHLYRSSR